MTKVLGCFFSGIFLASTFFTSIHVNAAKAQFILEKNPKNIGELQVDHKALCQVADNTQQYLAEHADDSFAVHAGQLNLPHISLQKVKETLRFICQQISQQQLNDPTFLAKHFHFYRWLPDQQQAKKLADKSKNPVKKRLLSHIPDKQIFLTKYYTKLLNGSEVKTAHYNQALYALPYDEQGLTQAQAENIAKQLTRYHYTRQQITAGVIDEKQLASPLIWLTEEALHDVLLQGTGVVKVNGKTRYFNVHRNNGIAYDYTLGKREQARYWYFAEVASILGYGQTLASKIAIIPDVAFAGNVKTLGLGKLFLVSFHSQGKQQGHLGVLADQGGAFDNNLFQLDWLKGSYYGWDDYYHANKHLPDYANAWLLLKK